MNPNRRESIFGISGLNNADRVSNKRQSMMPLPSSKRQSIAPTMSVMNRRETIMTDVQSMNQLKSRYFLSPFFSFFPLRQSILLNTLSGKESRKDVTKEGISENIKFLIEFFMKHNCSQYASAQILKNPKIDSRRFGFILQLDTEETSFNE